MSLNANVNVYIRKNNFVASSSRGNMKKEINFFESGVVKIGTNNIGQEIYRINSLANVFNSAVAKDSTKSMIDICECLNSQETLRYSTRANGQALGIFQKG